MTTFSDWLRNHPCSSRELWVLQNCIGSVFGFDHPVAKEAADRWQMTAARGEQELEQLRKKFKL